MFNPFRLKTFDSAISAGLDYVKGNTDTHGIFALAYGIITFIYGDKLWDTTAYSTASSVPYAPQSLGTVAIILGLLILYFSHKGRIKAVGWSVFFMAVWCFVFAIFFINDVFETNSPLGLPGVISYGHAGILMINRWVLTRRMSNDLYKKY